MRLEAFVSVRLFVLTLMVRRICLDQLLSICSSQWRVFVCRISHPGSFASLGLRHFFNISHTHAVHESSELYSQSINKVVSKVIVSGAVVSKLGQGLVNKLSKSADNL